MSIYLELPFLNGTTGKLSMRFPDLHYVTMVVLLRKSPHTASCAKVGGVFGEFVWCPRLWARHAVDRVVRIPGPSCGFSSGRLGVLERTQVVPGTRTVVAPAAARDIGFRGDAHSLRIESLGRRLDRPGSHGP